MSAKIIGIIGMFVTLIGGAANVISDAIDKKQTEAMVDEKIAKALANNEVTAENAEEEEEEK